MSRIIRQHNKTLLTGGAMVLAITASVFAQEKPFMQAGTSQPPPPLPTPPAAAPVAAGTNAPVAAAFSNPVDKLFNGEIPDALAHGKFNLNVRLRYEQVDDNNVPGITKMSYAPTIRTRFGYTTAPLYGFQGMLEAVNISVIGPEHNYNAAGSNGQGARPSVADPPMTRLDQAWLGYASTNYVNFSAKVGQQQINLDNQRFIGDASWRQNMQTYEAAGAQVSPVKDLNVYYSYIWNVNRVYGDVSGLPAANHDFNSQSHLINISYSGCPYGRLVGYAYLLDLSNSAPGPAANANSCATYGGYFAGAAPVDDMLMLDYRAEFAWQNQYGDNSQRYNADYYNFELGANIKPIALGAGYEVLGSGANSGAGGGRLGFKTPLASLHPFNGWAEVFVTHPNNGLQDIYEYAQLPLPGKIPVRFIYHKYYADYGSGNYGQEFDLMVSRRFGKNWSVMVEWADYQGVDVALPTITTRNQDVQKLWAAVECNF
ncbi:MAG: alginate export family protein [Verrucomicrobiia bacterium]